MRALLKDLVQEYKVGIRWIQTDANPADKLAWLDFTQDLIGSECNLAISEEHLKKGEMRKDNMFVIEAVIYPPFT